MGFSGTMTGAPAKFGSRVQGLGAETWRAKLSQIAHAQGLSRQGLGLRVLGSREGGGPGCGMAMLAEFVGGGDRLPRSR